MVGRLIEDFYIEGGRSSLRWSLPAELVPQMVRHQWGYLDIQVCAKFRSKYSLILYEMMSTLVRRKHRRDSLPVEELRNWLGVDRPEQDRKSVVQGQGVSVSVARGDRRIIKIQKNKK